MGKVAFVFPGQGNQYVGMGKDLHDKYPAARKVYELCGDKAIMDLSWNGTKEELTPTNIAQPAIFMAGLAGAYSLKEHGIEADGVAGYSLGEIPALAYSGLLSVEEAYKFVCFRAESMHTCTLEQQGGMSAVLGLTHQQVEEICAGIPGAYPVNYNAPSQIVAAYKLEAKDDLMAAVKEAKGKTMPLVVAGAFHSPLMDAATEKVRNYLKDTKFNDMARTLYSNVTGKAYGDPKELLADQINSPVQWQLLIENMIADGYDTFIETGPGKSLVAMIKKIDKNVIAKTLEEVMNDV